MNISKSFIATSRALTIAFIVAIAAITCGCEMANLIKSQVNLKENMARAVEESRRKSGIHLEPPSISSITSYPTNDPDLKVFLSYISALEYGLDGIRGETMGEKEYEAFLKETEVAIRKSYNNYNMKADQKFAATEKAIEELKQRGPLIYLKALPAGVDPKNSMMSVQVMPYPTAGSEGLYSKITAIGVVYKFKTVREVSQKAHEIGNKLRQVIATQRGWNILDQAAYKAQVLDKQSALGKNLSPEYMRQRDKMIEQQFEGFKAGTIIMSYKWDSVHREALGELKTPALNSMHITVSPVLTPDKGYYMLSISFSKSITQTESK